MRLNPRLSNMLSFSGRCITAAALLAFAAGTASAGTTINKINAVKLTKAQQELPMEELLDVNLMIFNPGIAGLDPEEMEEDNIYPRVRAAEAHYIPYQLRLTLERTNLWGAVRMVPEEDPISEVIVNGEILRSDGTEMAIRLDVTDATGRHWFTREYEDQASKFSYRPDLDIPGDPFQDVYNQVANDLYDFRQKLKAKQLSEIRTVANLKYAAELSPDAFGDHIKQNRKGEWEINRLPSEGDPMLQRVNRIRDSEYLFIDTVDQQYNRFYRQMDPSYSSWRRFSFEEIEAARELKASSRKRMAVGLGTVIAGAAVASQSNSSVGNVLGNAAAISGLGVIKQGYDVGKQADIHETALQELAASFNAEVEPIVIEVEGEVVKLNGTLDNQYKEWRQMLRRIYSDETGLPLDGAQAQQEMSPESDGSGT